MDRTIGRVVEERLRKIDQRHVEKIYFGSVVIGSAFGAADGLELFIVKASGTRTRVTTGFPPESGGVNNQVFTACTAEYPNAGSLADTTRGNRACPWVSMRNSTSASPLVTSAATWVGKTGERRDIGGGCASSLSALMMRSGCFVSMDINRSSSSSASAVRLNSCS